MDADIPIRLLALGLASYCQDEGEGDQSTMLIMRKGQRILVVVAHSEEAVDRLQAYMDAEKDGGRTVTLRETPLELPNA